jgi:hypothetical protein
VADVKEKDELKSHPGRSADFNVKNLCNLYGWYKKYSVKLISQLPRKAKQYTGTEALKNYFRQLHPLG